MRGKLGLIGLGLCLMPVAARAAPFGDFSERGSGSLFSGPAATALPSSSSLWLSLGAGLTRGLDRAGWQAFLALGVPLDRLAAPPLQALRPLPHSHALSEDAPAPSPPKPKQSPTPSTPPTAPPAPSTPPAPTPAPIPTRLTPALARGTVRHALAEAGLLARRGQLSGLATRARTSAALPELRLRALRSNGQTLRLTPTLGDPYQYTQGGTNELLLEARVTWRFDRLVFADEEVGIERLEADRFAAERKLLEHVLTELALWQRGLRRAADEDLEPEQRETAELEALSALVELDVLTDGWFSAAIGEPDSAFAASTGEPHKPGVDPASHAR